MANQVPSSNTPNAFLVNNLNTSYLNSSFLITQSAKAGIDLDEMGIERYNTDLGVMELLEALGNTRSVSSVEYQHAEQDFIEQNIVTQGITGGAKFETNVKISTDIDYVTSTSRSYYQNPVATTTFPIYDGMSLLLPGNVEVRVSAVDQAANTFTITSVNDENLPAVASGVAIPVTGSSDPEGSEAAPPMDSTLIQYKNYIQTISASYKVTDIAMGVKGMFEWEGSKFWYLKGIFDQRRRFNRLVEKAVLGGRLVATTDTELNNVSKTEGMIPFIQDNGHIVEYTSGALALADFDTLVDQLVQYSGSSENVLLSSISVNRQIDDFIRNSEGMKAGGIQYAGIGGEDRSVAYGFDSFIRSSHTFHYKTLFALNDPQGYGLSDFHKNLAIVAPLGQTNAFNFGNQGEGGRANYMNLVSISPEGYTDGYFEGAFGGAGMGNISTSEAASTVFMRKHFGFEGFCPNKFGLLTGV